MSFKEALLQNWDEEDAGGGVDSFLNAALDFIDGDTRSLGVSSERGWIATHLGVPLEELQWIKGPSDVSGGFYTPVERGGLRLMIHESREVAYLDPWPEGKDSKEVSQGLKKHFGLIPLRELQERSHGWTRVSESRLRKGDNIRVVDFEPELATKVGLAMESPGTFLKWNEERLQVADWIYLHRGDRIHVKGERPPGLVDIFGQELGQTNNRKTFAEGRGISRSGDGIWEATIPGFLGLRDGCLMSCSPVVVSPDEKGAYFLCHRGMVDLPSNHYQRFLDQAGVSEGIRKDGYEVCHTTMEEMVAGLKRVKIAKAIEPIDGVDAKLDWKVPPLDTPGEVQEDGTIDYRAGKRVFLAKEGEVIAIKKKATSGKDGISVLGHAFACRKGMDRRFSPGDNVEVEDSEEGVLYKAEVQGVPKLNKSIVELSPSLVLPEGVNFNTGNVDFDGDVIVDGSVQHGFSVRARGKVTVFDSIENGAEVSCLGTLRVGKGIIGAKTRVIAKGNIETRFVQDATVMGGSDLKITDHLYHAKVRCEGKVLVDRCSVSDRSGSIVGGYVWGIKGLKAHYLGSPSEAQTVVGVGLDEMRLNSREEVQRQADELHRQVMVMVQKCGLPNIKKETLEAFEQKQPKAKPVMDRLREVLRDYQKRLTQIEEMDSMGEGDSKSVKLEIENRCFANVTINHGRHQKAMKKTNFCKVWMIKEGNLISR